MQSFQYMCETGELTRNNTQPQLLPSLPPAQFSSLSLYIEEANF